MNGNSINNNNLNNICYQKDKARSFRLDAVGLFTPILKHTTTMTLEELSNGLGVPVSKAAYCELDAIYLEESVYLYNSQFIDELKKQFPSQRDRSWLVRTMERIHAMRS